jgi:outer membrane protein assembly factor BamA
MGMSGWAAAVLLSCCRAGATPEGLQDDTSAPPAPAKTSADTSPSFYPLPAIASDKNAGVTYGLLGALVFQDENGRPEVLLSATLAYQSLVKVNGDLNLHWYPSESSELEFDGALSQRVESEFKLSYRDLRFLDHYDFRAEVHEHRSSTDRFFGRAEDAPHSDQSVLTSNQYWVNTAFGPRVTDEITLQGSFRWRSYRVGPSLITNLPQMLDQFPEEPGIEGGDVLAPGARGTFDSRDFLTTPTRGTRGIVYAEYGWHFSEGRSIPFWVLGTQWTWLLPMDFERAWVTVVNAQAQAVVGRRIPFWELSSLGGSTTLRSFNEGRFTDNDMVVLNLEERIRVLKVSLFGTSGEVQVAPFFDVGKVLDSLDDLVGSEAFQHIHTSYGVGFRGVVPPSFVGRLDVAYGREGLGISVGLNYPF